jgi:hypothetical protein
MHVAHNGGGFFFFACFFLFLDNKNAFLQIIWKNKYMKVALVWKV